MNLTQFALDKQALTKFVIFLVVAGGLFSYATLGRLEDPDYTVKTAIIATAYPGASPLEVELEVTDLLELAIQEMPQLDTMYSQSRAGLSIIRVDMKEQYWSDSLPQVWDELRRKVNDASPRLPPGALKPDIGDDFSFVFGFVLSISGDDYSYTELEDYAKLIRKELGLVEGVGTGRSVGRTTQGDLFRHLRGATGCPAHHQGRHPGNARPAEHGSECWLNQFAGAELAHRSYRRVRLT